MLVFVAIFGVLVALGLCFAGAWSDFNGLVIPNIYPAGIVLAFVFSFGIVTFIMPDNIYFDRILSHIIAALVVFVLTFGLFALKLLGAGDSKLATAVALWAGLANLMSFLFFMAIGGAVLGAAALYIQRRKPFAAPREGGWIASLQAGENKVPYGIAIAIGALVAFVQAGYFNPDILTSLQIGGGGGA